jgi:hypothetical protein
MACYIFLKSLRSLEEFRKNPHVKIPPKSSCANFHALVNSKIQFLIQKFFFLISARPPPLFFFPAQPRPTSSLPVRPSRTELVRFSSLQKLSVFTTCPILLLLRFLHFKTCPIRPLRPQAAARALSPLGPLGPSRVVVFAERRILFYFAHFGRDTFSLSRHCHVGSACQLHPLPPRRPTVATRRLRPPRTAQPPTSRCQVRSSLHVLISPPKFHSLTPHQATPPSMALRLLPPAVSPSLPRCAPPRPL